MAQDGRCRFHYNEVMGESKPTIEIHHVKEAKSVICSTGFKLIEGRRM